MEKRETILEITRICGRTTQFPRANERASQFNHVSHALHQHSWITYPFRNNITVPFNQTGQKVSNIHHLIGCRRDSRFSFIINSFLQIDIAIRVRVYMYTLTSAHCSPGCKCDPVEEVIS